MLYELVYLGIKIIRLEDFLAFYKNWEFLLPMRLRIRCMPAWVVLRRIRDIRVLDAFNIRISADKVL